MNSIEQEAAFQKFSRLKCGALFMSMGTGKTKVALDLAAAKMEQEKCDYVMYIAPANMIDSGTVQTERDKWQPKLELHFFTCEGFGASDRKYLDALSICENHKVFCIVDESLKIKNITAKRTKRIISLGEKCAYRLILNGTPLSKNILDLWAQMEFLSPKILKMTYRQFKDTFCVYYNKGKLKGKVKNQYNVPYLISLIEPYIYQAELDIEVKKNYDDEYYYVNHEDYDEYKEELFNEYCDANNDLNFEAFSTKLQRYYTSLPEHENAVQKVIDSIDGQTVVFVKYLDNIPSGAVRYVGNSGKQERKQILEDFAAGKFKVLYMTYGCGSMSLNLQFCKHIVFADHTWDYAMRIQAEGRIYRMNSDSDVTYHDIICGNSGLEDMILSCIHKKKSKLKEVKEEINNAKGDKEKLKKIVEKM